MKEKVKYLAVGMLIGSIVSTAAAGYAAGSDIQVYYKQLRFMFDGTEKKATGGQPFIYEGTTYVPLRFMSEAIGKAVQYDGKRDTIWVGNRYMRAPVFKIDTSKTYTATISTTKGDITIELFADKAPIAVNNFIFLAKDGFYDDIVFHRILRNYVIQTGDPSGTGQGGPGYTFKDELNNGIKYEPGIVAMANAGPDTNGSQFFVCTGTESEYLNNIPNYTIFGRVSEGMDAVRQIADSPVTDDPHMPEKSRPVEEIKINGISIQEKAKS